jgi:hypothetical protein
MLKWLLSIAFMMSLGTGLVGCRGEVEVGQSGPAAVEPAVA